MSPFSSGLQRRHGKVQPPLLEGMQLHVPQADRTTSSRSMNFLRTSPSGVYIVRPYQLARGVRAVVLPGKEQQISIGWVSGGAGARANVSLAK
jgi:hypothetical protein